MVMSTLATPIRSREQLDDPACVKVVFDAARPGAVFQPQPDSARPRVGRRAADGRSAAFLSAHRAVRLSPRFSAAAGRAAAHAAGKTGKPGATARARNRLRDRRRRGRRADRGHRHAGGLSGVCQSHRCRGKMRFQGSANPGPAVRVVFAACPTSLSASFTLAVSRCRGGSNSSSTERVLMTKHIFVTGGVVSSWARG